MKKFLFTTLIALMGLAQQVLAADVVNNSACDVDVTAVVYNTSTCAVTITCMTVTVPARSTATLPGCVAIGTSELLGFNVCWAAYTCTKQPCVSIGNSTGAHPCTQFPAGPVYLSTACTPCTTATPEVKISWGPAVSTGGANLIIG